MIGDSPNFLTPIPLHPYRGALWGGQGGLYEGVDLMSLTPKCYMFLEKP